MKANFTNSTICTPVKDKSDFAKKSIEHNLKNSPMNIIVLYDEGDENDYIINERVTYIKNQSGRNFPKILNQLIKSCPTEYIVYCNWRNRPTYEQHELAFDKLNQGFGLVDLSSPLLYTVFSKHLISIIGFFDERFVGGHCVDWDLIFNLYWYDIAHYNIDICNIDYSLATPNNPTYTTWYGDCGNRENYIKFSIKWNENKNELKRVLKEINYKDKKILENLFEKREYLPYEKSVLEVNWVKERMIFKGKKI